MKSFLLILIFLSTDIFGNTFSELLDENGKLPVPFKKLMEKAGSKGNDISLIPGGRSLVKDDSTLRQPRIVFTPFTGPDAELPAKYFIGYTPKTDSLEIMIWNPKKKTYDFTVVKDYSNKEKQKIQKPHKGTCTSCHPSGTTLYSPPPWLEMLGDETREEVEKNGGHKVPKKIYETIKENGELDLWKNEYGIDLDEYVKNAFSSTINFFNAATFSQDAKNNHNVCEILCTKGSEEEKRECRRLVLESTIEINIADRKVLSEKFDKKIDSVVEKQFKLLEGAMVPIIATDIPDKDPFSDRYFRNAATDEERKRVRANGEAFFKQYVEDNNIDLSKMSKHEIRVLKGNVIPPLIRIKLEVVGDELKELKDNGGVPKKDKERPLSQADIATALKTGNCYLWNKDQINELKDKLDLDKFSSDLKTGKFDDLLKSWPIPDESLFKELLKSQGKSAVAKSDTHNFDCAKGAGFMKKILPAEDKVITDLKDTVFLTAVDTISKIKDKNERVLKSYELFCMNCHIQDDQPKKLKKVPFNDLEKLKEYKKGTSKSALMKMKKDKMPPDDSTEGVAWFDNNQSKAQRLKQEMLEALQD